MTVTPSQWIEQVAKAVARQDWDLLTALEVDVCQSYADSRDWAGLERFYTEVLVGSVKPDVVEQVRVKDVSPFQAGVEEALQQAIQRASDNPNIKAIYFEYFYDGGDSCSGNAFLCTAYDQEDDSWASEFEGASSVINGPNVYDYLSYDPEIDFDPHTDAVAKEYVHGMLLAAWGRAVDSLGHVSLPMGFAQHDHPVIRTTPFA